MAIIDFSGDFSTEIKNLETLKDDIDEQLAAIETELSNLPNFWKDENSSKWLTEHNQAMAELKTANIQQKQAADQYFSDIVKELKIYNQ